MGMEIMDFIEDYKIDKAYKTVKEMSYIQKFDGWNQCGEKNDLDWLDERVRLEGLYKGNKTLTEVEKSDERIMKVRKS